MTKRREAPKPEERALSGTERQSRHGGWAGVMRVLQRNEWVEYCQKSGMWHLTLEGEIKLEMG